MHSMQNMLPRMPLSDQASTVMHSMMRLIDGENEELRRDAVSSSNPINQLMPMAFYSVATAYDK